MDMIKAILDEAFICHVGFAVNGRPFVIPTNYARVGKHLLIQASAASRRLSSLSEGIPVCVTVTLLDGLVLGRSAFHHSVNYRSAVIFGVATRLQNAGDKIAALRAFTEHIIPGRWPEVREPNEQELKATTVLSLPLTEVSAKIRTGPPKIAQEDYAIPVWAGELPLHVLPGMPLADLKTSKAKPVPNYVMRYERRVKQ
jgi:nitroimidazol reductase NimA-like FMN-containing flavoprotein (pyridoxamine 5'-phosphate oxidase superfamily)